jgi:Tfp pilus assembly protein PilO
VNLKSATGTKIVGALALLVVAALGWLLVVGPRTDAVAEAREQVELVREQNAALATQLASLQRQKEDLRPVKKVAKRLAKEFPPTADQPGLFGEITEAAVAAGIGPEGVTALSPSAPTIGGAEQASGATSASPVPSNDQLARQEVSVSVQGDYGQTIRLLENLEDMDRAYLVTAVDLTGTEGDYTTTVVGSMFVMRPVPKP